MISQGDKETLKLIQRSPDRGDGWRTVSDRCWLLISAFQQKELIEVDVEGKRVRFTDAGEAVTMFGI